MAEETAPNPFQKALSTGKDLLPLFILLYQVVYGIGVKSSTSDRMQQQQAEDHLAITEVRTQLADLTTKQAALAAKVEMMIAANFRSNGK